MESDPARVWVIDLDLPYRLDLPDRPGPDPLGDDIPGDPRWLDRRERDRAAALRDPATSRRYVSAHLQLRILLASVSQTTPDDIVIDHEACTACGGDHGRPFVPGGPHFSLSRSGSWAAIALSNTERVGVDLEVRHPAEDLEPLRSDLLAPDEHSNDLLRTWVRKEAFVKASGEGLNRSLATVPPDAGPIHDLPLPEGIVGAVAGVSSFTLESRASTKVRQPMPTRSLPESAA